LNIIPASILHAFIIFWLDFLLEKIRLRNKRFDFCIIWHKRWGINSHLLIWSNLRRVKLAIISGWSEVVLRGHHIENRERALKWRNGSVSTG
jgi:hypothetical protein